MIENLEELKLSRKVVDNIERYKGHIFSKEKYLGDCKTDCSVPAVIIISKFNLYIKKFREDCNINISEASSYVNWLRARANLIYAPVASLINQIDSDFHWLVYFDVEDSDIVQGLVKKLSHLPFFHPVYFDSRRNFNETQIDVERRLNESVLSNISALDIKNDKIAMTRLDTDDALSVYYVYALKKYVSVLIERNSQLKLNYLPFPASFVFGAMIDSRSLRTYMWSSNAFSAMICTTDSVVKRELGKTILGYNHASLINLVGYEEIVTNFPMWLQVNHGGNVLNKQKNFLPSLLMDDFNLERFGLRHEGIDRFLFDSSNMNV